MVSIFVPVDSAYTFTQDLRYYKANDPYYFQVDNIPIKQLQENVLWLKDQLNADRITNVIREDIDELRPYVNGNDRTVRVMPGRFSARINDAYGIGSRQRAFQVFIEKLTGDSLGRQPNDWLEQPETWNVLTLAPNPKLNEDPYTWLSDLYDVFVNTTAQLSNATYMNGLAERAFTFPVKDEDNNLIRFLTTTPTTKDLKGQDRPIFPISESLNFFVTQDQITYAVSQWNSDLSEKGFGNLNRYENELIKRWRGIFRTSIVDVAEELSLEIPEFSSDDFYVKTGTSEKTLIEGGTVRIDLLFIYSKPIDASSTTIAKYVNGAATEITKPELGIVYGAGLGFDSTNRTAATFEPESAIDSEGVSKMMANPSDELDTNIGFSGLSIHGSFPSPDDLMNLAPALNEKLANEHFDLVGQSVLPVAYIVTTKGVDNIPTTSVIDIRPFFRTTELAYNERAGIAAAYPQLSLANPAVGQAQMDRKVKDIVDDYNIKISEVRDKLEFHTRPVGSGYIFGGFNFGVEGAYWSFLANTLGNQTEATLKAEVKRRMGLPSPIDIPDYPDWDLAKWTSTQAVTEAGLHTNDYINTMCRRNGGADSLNFGSFSDSSLSPRISRMGTDNFGKGTEGYVNIHFVKKTVFIDRSRVNWMSDYIVNASLLNCVPLSCRQTGREPEHWAGAHGIWVEYAKDYFTIHVAWVANDHYGIGRNFSERNILEGHETSEGAWPYNNRDGHYFTGFAVINDDVMKAKSPTPAFNGDVYAGAATYPTISFEVIGVPITSESHTTSLNPTNPTIVLG